MPNPKMGTVTKDVTKAVKTAKAGAVQFRVMKHGILHCGVGKVSFTNEQILENLRGFMVALGDTKPEGLKGKYIERAHIASTMGNSFPVEVSSIDPTSPKFFLDPSILQKEKDKAQG